MNRLKGLIVAAVVAGHALPARAGGSTQTSFGTRRNGMMAVMGRPDDLTALFHNPAGLADQGGVRLYLFGAPTFLNNRFRVRALDPDRFPEINPPGCGEPGRDPCPWPIGSDGYYTKTIEPERYFGILPFAAASTDLGFLSSKLSKVVASLAVTAPNFYGAYLPENAPTSYFVIGGAFLVVATTAGFGWRINRYISVGANVSYNYMYLSLAQKLSVINALTPPGQQPDDLTLVAQEWLGDIKMKYTGTDHGAGWNTALLVTPVEGFSFGIAYTGATPARFEGDVNFKALSEDAQRDPQMLERLLRGAGYKLPHRLVVENRIPHALYFGFNVQVAWWLELGMDMRLWFYNIIKRQKIKPIYDPDEPGEEPMTEESLTKDKDYKMSWQVAAGALFRPFTGYRNLEFLVGWGYDEAPLRDRTFTMDNPSLDIVKVTLGVRWRIDYHWQLAAAYLFNYYVPRDIRLSETNPPTLVKGYGFSHSPSLEMTYVF